MDISIYLNYWAERYKQDLTTNILPFWLKNGLDRKYGGVYTCLDREGHLMDSTKSVWFQGRFAFVCCFAYNRVEKRSEWLEAAKFTLDFIEKYCIDKNGRMYFEVKEDGTPLRMRRYVFSECFASLAMSEYALATGDYEYAKKALKIFKNIRYFLNSSNILEPKYMPSVKMQGHSIIMILINVALHLKRVIEDPVLDKQIDESLFALKNYFIHPEYKALLETVGPKGEFIDTLNGRIINPGHCIETSWFLFDVAMDRGGDKAVIDLGLKIFDWSWQWGWDEKYGGFINFKDCKKYPSQDYSQDMKFWWPQTETIIASLYAYKLTGDTAYLKRHQLVSDWTYAHFPDVECGEWYGYLHRDGSVAQPAKGNIFKGPFHIPRMMVKCYSLCKDFV